MRILVVEDDQLLNNTLCYNLTTEGYVVDSVMTRAEATKSIKTKKYELVILDVNLPDGNGFDLCHVVKENIPEAAVIFLTANDMESNMIKGFELGADDYVTKPFHISVFCRKVSALAARLQKQSKSNYYNDGNFYINFDEMTASIAGKTVTFTTFEYRLLNVLTKNHKIVLTRQALLEKLWDIEGNFVDEHALTAAISRIRNKIENDGFQYIKTVYGMGYMWIGEVNR